MGRRAYNRGFVDGFTRSGYRDGYRDGRGCFTSISTVLLLTTCCWWGQCNRERRDAASPPVGISQPTTLPAVERDDPRSSSQR
jgi:hypothetical protein